MDLMIPPSVLRREAKAETRRLRRPDGMHRLTWAGVQVLLLAICAYLPRAWPSLRTLEQKTGMPRASLHRWVSVAIRHGLLETTPQRLGRSNREGTKYRLPYLSEDLLACLDRGGKVSHLGTEQKTSSSREVDTEEPTVLPLGDPRSPAPDVQEPGRVIPMPRRGPDESDWQTTAYGEDTRAPLPGHSRPADPAIRLARYFDQQWVDHVVAHCRKIRMTPPRSSDRGRCIGYLRSTLLPQRNERWIMAYIDLFVDMAVAGEVTFREGQTGFQRFTSWWGTQEIDDPEVALAQAAEAARIRSALADQPRLSFWEQAERLTGQG